MTICCQCCGMPITTWDDPIYDPLPVRYRLLARCDEKECADFGEVLQVKSRDGEYWFIPPYSNRGVTSPKSTPAIGEN